MGTSGSFHLGEKVGDTGTPSLILCPFCSTVPYGVDWSISTISLSFLFNLFGVSISSRNWVEALFRYLQLSYPGLVSSEFLSLLSVPPVPPPALVPNILFPIIHLKQ